MEPTPTTLREAIIYYSDLTACTKRMIASRWPNGVACIHCGVIGPKFMRSVQRFKCYSCKKQFSVKVGTIFEDSPIPLTKWLPAVWLLTGAKNGISSYELSRAIGVTQKTAWFMLHRIREAIASGTIDMFNGPVEADETAVGGLEKNKHAHKRLRTGRGGDHNLGKSIVMGILERGEGGKKSKVRAGVIHDIRGHTLQRKIRESVRRLATLYTDAHKGYRGLSGEYIHEFVDHALIYALGQVHTNGIENFWALLKRCLKGTYIAVQPFHLRRYIDEMVFRFNERDGEDSDRFLSALRMVEGKRLTFDALTRSYEAYYDQVMPRNGSTKL